MLRISCRMAETAAKKGRFSGEEAKAYLQKLDDFSVIWTT